MRIIMNSVPKALYFLTVASVRINLTRNLYKVTSKFNTFIPKVTINETINNVNIIQTRYYAKGKDKKKDKGKSNVQVNESQLGEVINIESYKTSLNKAIDVLKDDYTKSLSLRSAAGSIESLIVNVDGNDHTLQELAQIVRKNPKLVVVNMAVFPQAIPAAIKAIEKSGLNINPQQDGTTLYLPVPKVTKEHRENLAKNAKALFIKCRDSMKDAQNKQVKSLKKKDGISVDIVRNLEAQIIALSDKQIKEAEKIFESKQKELLGAND